MKMKDRIRRDREEMTGLDRMGRLLFLWDYYKIPILSVVIVAAMMVITVATGVRSSNAAMYAVFVNTVGEGSSAALDEILESGDVALKGRHVKVTADLHLGREMDQDEDIRTVQILAALFGVSGLDFFAADEATFQRYADQNAFLDLSLFIEKDILDARQEDLLLYENEEGQTVLGGIRLHPDSRLHRAGYFVTDIVVGVAANAQNMEEAVRFLKQLL